VTQDKLLRVVARLYKGDGITTEQLRERYGCSPAGAKRVMRKLRDTLPVVAERDGQAITLSIRNAVRPAISTTWLPR
jgi:hypothetical protein